MWEFVAFVLRNIETLLFQIEKVLAFQSPFLSPLFFIHFSPASPSLTVTTRYSWARQRKGLKGDLGRIVLYKVTSIRIILLTFCMLVVALKNLKFSILIELSTFLISHHHHVVLLAWISLTLSCYLSLLSIALGRSSKLHPVSAQSCWR